jgi:Tol biopolymer transport system component
LAISRDQRSEAPAFAWFVIALLVISPYTASYVFVLLLVPVALLLKSAPTVWSLGLLALYVLIQLPIRPWYAGLFPKAWLLLALLIYTGWRFLPSIRPSAATAVLALVMVASAIDAWRRWNSYRLEPPSVAAHAVVQPKAIFSSAPAVGKPDVVYQAIAQERYSLRLSEATGIKTLVFDGHALHPAIGEPDGPIYFELVAHRHSRICSFDYATKKLDVEVGPELDPIEPAISDDGTKLAFVSGGSLYVRDGGRLSRIYRSQYVSSPTFFPDGQRIAFAEGPQGRRSIRAVPVRGGEPQTLVQGGDTFEPSISSDGTLLAYAASESGGRQVWVRNLVSGSSRPITSGACNNDSPAWRPNSRSVIFASDCRRGLGLPALYETLAQ